MRELLASVANGAPTSPTRSPVAAGVVALTTARRRAPGGGVDRHRRSPPSPSDDAGVARRDGGRGIDGSRAGPFEDLADLVAGTRLAGESRRKSTSKEEELGFDLYYGVGVISPK
jgi:hypothetical protein